MVVPLELNSLKISATSIKTHPLCELFTHEKLHIFISMRYKFNDLLSLSPQLGNRDGVVRKTWEFPSPEWHYRVRVWRHVDALHVISLEWNVISMLSMRCQEFWILWIVMFNHGDSQRNTVQIDKKSDGWWIGKWSRLTFENQGKWWESLVYKPLLFWLCREIFC